MLLVLRFPLWRGHYLWARITPLFRGPHEDDPQKVCIVMQIEDDSKLEAFMVENEASIIESGHLLETTESNTYL